MGTQSTWGRFVANSRRGKMKTILALALAALVAAEPEAKPEADAYYDYGYGLCGYYGGYRTYGLGYSHGLYYGKREAEAEPEADAYYGYGYGLGGYYGGYRTYGLGYGYGHGLYYGKREAEAEPYYGYAAHAVAPVVSTYAAAPAVAPVVSSYAQVPPSASLSTVGIAPAAIPAVGGAYAGAGRYVANSAGTVHVAKREAEADPYYYGGYYGRGYGLGYRSYGYGLGYGRGYYWG